MRVTVTLVLVLGDLGDERLGREEEAGDGGGVLEGLADDLGGVDDALVSQVAVLQGGGVEAVARALDLGGDDGALEARVLGDGLDRGLDRLTDDRETDRLVAF